VSPESFPIASFQILQNKNKKLRFAYVFSDFIGLTVIFIRKMLTF